MATSFRRSGTVRAFLALPFVLAALSLACSSGSEGPSTPTMGGSPAASLGGGNPGGSSAAGKSSSAGGSNGGASSDAGGSSNAGGVSNAGTMNGGAPNAGATNGAATNGGATNGGVAALGGSAADAGAAAALVATPAELVFGAVQQTQTAPQTIVLKNPSSVAVQLASVKLEAAAAGTPAFELVAPPATGAEIAPGGTTNVQVRFHPTGIALFKSNLVVALKEPAFELSLGLFGLGTKGLEGENEPFLKIVLDTLGYAVNVGGAGVLSTTTPLVGDEVAAPRFKAASAAEIQLIPVARYSPQEPIPYGYYDATEVEVGVIADDQYQALNPTTEAGSKRSFAAPAADFGIFTTSKTHKTYTEDAKNAANATKHAVRTYPLKDRAGTIVPHSYLVCFEEAANGDYQDYVFTLSNVTPVAP